MSKQLIDHSFDLKKLRDDGFTISVKDGLLIIEDIPYVNSKKEISEGTLISNLAMSSSQAKYDNNHVVFFIGEQPCYKDGSIIGQITHQVKKTTHIATIVSDMSFSNKPLNGYTDYYHKMITYINILSSQAESLDSDCTPKKFKTVVDIENESVFNYYDTNSSRADILGVSHKLKGHKIGIIGLGGTGSYILDMVAKTHVDEIRIFDGDTFLTHNAFRAPGAPSVEELDKQPYKAEYFADKYTKMHKGITPYSEYIFTENVNKLAGLNFVFVSIDVSSAKQAIFDYLDSCDIPYIDVGMGIEVVDGMLHGSIRTTAIFTKDDHCMKQYINMHDTDEDDAYQSNIQIAELNAFNASMAVINWKKFVGFYLNYMPDSNHVVFNIDTRGIIGNIDET